MRSRALHSQILAVNSLLMVAAVAATAATAGSRAHGAADAGQWLVLGPALVATILVNAIVLARRLQPVEELLATMEAVDRAATWAVVRVEACSVVQAAMPAVLSAATSTASITPIWSLFSVLI